jgi:hypothetical protein
MEMKIEGGKGMMGGNHQNQLGHWELGEDKLGRKLGGMGRREAASQMNEWNGMIIQFVDQIGRFTLTPVN